MVPNAPQLTTRSPPPKLIGRGYGGGATRNGEVVERDRGSVGAAHSRFNDISKMDVTGAGALFMSAEYTVKAVEGAGAGLAARIFSRWYVPAYASTTEFRWNERRRRSERSPPDHPFRSTPFDTTSAGRVGRAKREEDTSSWKATPLQKAVAAGGMVATAAIGGALIVGGACSTVGSGAVVVASMIGAYLVTDMGSAMVHVVIDNLDCEKVPESLRWLRRLVEDFQNHHENPRDIVKREFANLTADAQVIATPILIGLVIAAITRPHLAPLIAAATVSANAAVLSQEFHKRSHMRPDESAPIWQLLKDIGLAVSTKMHAKHHTQGHKSHYALLNGFTNVFLDGVKFKLTPRGPNTNLIRKIEVAIYGLTAAEPQSWRENPGLRGIALGLEPGREEMSARANRWKSRH
jgi:Lipid desaturase domain